MTEGAVPRNGIPTGNLSALVLVPLGDSLPGSVNLRVPGFSCLSGVVSPGFAAAGRELFTWLEVVDPKPSTGSSAQGQHRKGAAPRTGPVSGIPLVGAGGFFAAWFLANRGYDVHVSRFLLCVKFKGRRGPTSWVAALTFWRWRGVGQPGFLLHFSWNFTRRSPGW